MSSDARRGRARAGTSRPDCAVFLDKDGTLIANVPYNVDPERVALAPDACAALGKLAASGFKLIVVSNQSGIGDGRFTAAALKPVERRIQALLAPAAAIDAFYYCPHSAGRGCDCRKPEPGLLYRAAAELGIDLGSSWLIGDILDDIEAGARAGCRTALIDNGNETEWELTPRRRPHCITRSLHSAASVILATRHGNAAGGTEIGA